jgi:hypothetical protein
LQPIEFVELDNIETSVVKEQETGEKLEEQVKLSKLDNFTFKVNELISKYL